MSESVVYCVDTSALIDLWQIYRIGTIPGLWEKLGGLVKAARLIAPREVLNEVKDHDLRSWLKKNKKMFVKLIVEQTELVAKILKQFPGKEFFDPAKQTPDADPFVIALAMSKKAEEEKMLAITRSRYVVLTCEKFSSK